MQNMQYQTKLSPSYPQVIPRVIPKKVLPTAKCAVPHAKYAVPTAKYAVPNKVIPKLSPELSPKRCYHLQNVQYSMQNIQYPLQNTQYTMQNTQYPLQNMQYNLQNTQYQTKLSPSYPQSYPQWICRRKIDLKNKSKCFILT